MSTTPPIGFVLKKLDRLIDERFERTLGRHGVTRRQWQVMNTLKAGPASSHELDAAVAPFLDAADRETVAQHLEPVVSDGWVEIVDGAYALTGHGRTTLDRLAQDVDRIREITASGIDRDRYETTVGTLQAMIANLERAS